MGTLSVAGAASVRQRISAARPAEDAVAVVAGTEISREEFQDVWHQTRLTHEIMRRPWPNEGTDAYASLRASVLGLTVRRHVLALEANERGVRVFDDEVERSLEQIKRDIFDGNAESLQRDFQEKRLDKDAVVETIRAQIIERKLFLQVTAEIDVPRAAARRYYQAHLAEFRLGPSREMVFVAFASKRQAESWVRSVAGQRNRAVPTQRVVVERDRVDRSVWEVVASLRSNVFSAPVMLDDDWYVLQPLAALTQPRIRPFLEVEKDLRARLSETKKRSMFERWVRQAVAHADVRYPTRP